MIKGRNYNHPSEPFSKKPDSRLRLTLRAKAQNIRKTYFKLHNDNPQLSAMPNKIHNLLDSIKDNDQAPNNTYEILETNQNDDNQTSTKKQQKTQPVSSLPSFSDMLYRVTKQTKQQAKRKLRSNSYNSPHCNSLSQGFHAKSYPTQKGISDCFVLSPDSRIGTTMKHCNQSQNNLSNIRKSNRIQNRNKTCNYLKTVHQTNKKGHLYKGLANCQNYKNDRSQYKKSQVICTSQSKTKTQSQYNEDSEQESMDQFKPVGMVARYNQLSRIHLTDQKQSQYNQEQPLNHSKCHDNDLKVNSRLSRFSRQQLKQAQHISYNCKQLTIQDYCSNGKTLIYSLEKNSNNQNNFSSEKNNDMLETKNLKTQSTAHVKMLGKNQDVMKNIIAQYNSKKKLGKQQQSQICYINGSDIWNDKEVRTFVRQSKTTTISKKHKYRKIQYVV